MTISSVLGSSALLPAGLGFRNVLINGDFKVWQRGTSKAMATGSGTGFIADRWTAARAGYAAGGTVSRQTASLDGFQYCARVQRDSGNTSTVSSWYFQTLETVTSIPLANKPVVYSFYIRAGANFSGTVTAQLYSGTATDQQNYPDAGITGSVTVIASALSLTTSWQRVVLYGNVGASATQLFAGFQHAPSGTAGAADYFEITGVQVEQNTQPTPFEQRPYGVELQLCQRYYVRKTATTPYSIFGFGQFGGTTTTPRVAIPLNVPMRVNPTSIDSGGTLNMNQHYVANYTATSITLNPNSGNHTTTAEIGFTIPSAGPTAGTYGVFGAGNDSSAYVGFSAEL